MISPDGRWVAYQSPAAGDARVYVQPLSGEGKWQLSKDGADWLLGWNDAGTELGRGHRPDPTDDGGCDRGAIGDGRDEQGQERGSDDNRRQHKGNRCQVLKQGFPFKIIPCKNIGPRQGDHNCQ